MKLNDHFKDFLDETVNINATRLEQLDSSVEAIKNFVRTAEWSPRVRYFTEQGSWAHRTIIKPVEGNPFDADLLVMVDPVDGWGATTYVTSLHGVFAENGVYKDKVKRWSHCITIEYAGERKIDVAPCVADRITGPSEEVCNHDANLFEPAAAESYTAWLLEKNSWTGGNALRKVTRLLKYLRDIKEETFTCPSFLLTTLLGERIGSGDAQNTTDFADIPTSLRTIVARLDDWLQARTQRPDVLNPVLLSEVISELWTDDEYATFRTKIHQYREWIDDAYQEAKRDESIGKWRRVFGDAFAKGVVLDKATRVTEAARHALASLGSLISHGQEDLVALFTRFGRRALPPDFDDLPHKDRPTWRWVPGAALTVEVAASMHWDKGGPKERDVASGEGPLPKERWLRFVVHASSRLPARDESRDLLADYQHGPRGE